MKASLSILTTGAVLALLPARSPATSAARAGGVAPHREIVALSLGRSAAVHALFALPGDMVAPPIGGASEADALRFRWVDAEGRTGSEQRSGAGGGFRLVAPDRPGDYVLEADAGSGFRAIDTFRLLVKVPAAEAEGGTLRGYAVGRWPAGRAGRYAPPDGFTEVTLANRDLRVSEHFRLRDFLTHDRANVWPTYVVIDSLLLDKLELVIAEVASEGIPAGYMHVMSGFRTPRYNAQGLDQGRSPLSRHQYGDAADVWVDADRDGWIDDLDGDGRRALSDARFLARLAARVEARFPELAGGIGVYPATSAHGPFVHIDARGTTARW